MNKKVKSIFVKVGLPAILCMLALCVFACGNTAVVAPQVSGVTLTVQSGDTRGLVGIEHVLGYTATEGSAVTVTVQKNGSAAQQSDYTYTESNKKIVFHKAGVYTLTVRAEKDGVSDEGTISVTVIDHLPDEITGPIILTVGEEGQTATVQERETIPFDLQIIYAAGDSKKTETVDVFHLKNGIFENVTNTNSYEWVGEGYTSFRPLVAGLYQIKVTAESVKGSYAECSTSLQVTPAPISLSLADGNATANGWLRVAADAATEIPLAITYESDNAAVDVANYEINCTTDSTAVTAEVVTGAALSVQSSVIDTSHISVICVNKYDSTCSAELQIPLSVVSDVANAPVLGEDPFDGTYNCVITSTGLMLYYDITKGGNKVGVDDVTFSVAGYDITGGGNSFGVSIDYVRGDKNYPFLLVSDFEHNEATGYVTVKLTATVSGATAAASKMFYVDPLAKDGKEKTNVEGLNEYADHIFDRNGMNMDKIMSFDNRQNMVICKDGLIINRAWGNGNIAVVEPNGADNFQVDFTYTIVKRLDNNNKASFAVNCRTGSWNGWCDRQTAFYAEDDKTQIKAGYWGDKIMQEEGTHPDATIGKKYHIRFTHTKEGNTVHFVWQWSEDGVTYNDWLKYDVNSSSTAGNIGSKVYAMQFNHEAGCYILGGITLKILD